MVDDAGAIRPAWRPLIDRLDWLDRAELDARFARADHYLHDSGVYYRVYGDGGSNERAWPLAHVPLLIEEAEWQGIAAGLVAARRAAGARAGRHLRRQPAGRRRADPAAAHRRQPGISAAHGRHRSRRRAASCISSPSISAAVPTAAGGCSATARRRRPAPASRWRTASPPRARSPTSMSAMNVHRLAGFFRDLRDALFDLANDPTGVAILTPGQHTETYFEHAYIARYLGLLLLEGEDLTVAGGKVMVRTVDGPAAAQRALAAPRCRLHRSARTQARFPHRHAGPGRRHPPGRRHHRQRHRLGHPRDARAARLPARHQPRLSTARTLTLPHIATWWCGQEARARAMCWPISTA